VEKKKDAKRGSGLKLQSGQKKEKFGCGTKLNDVE